MKYISIAILLCSSISLFSQDKNLYRELKEPICTALKTMGTDSERLGYELFESEGAPLFNVGIIALGVDKIQNDKSNLLFRYLLKYNVITSHEEFENYKNNQAIPSFTGFAFLKHNNWEYSKILYKCFIDNKEYFKETIKSLPNEKMQKLQKEVEQENRVTVNDGVNVNRNGEGNKSNIIFEGEGNSITFNNSNITNNSNRDTSTIIIKGDNNNIVINNDNITDNVDDENQTFIFNGENQELVFNNYDIDLSENNVNNKYFTIEYVRKVYLKDFDLSIENTYLYYKQRIEFDDSELKYDPIEFKQKYINHVLTLPESEDKYMQLHLAYKAIGDSRLATQAILVTILKYKNVDNIGWITGNMSLCEEIDLYQQVFEYGIEKAKPSNFYREQYLKECGIN